MQLASHHDDGNDNDRNGDKKFDSELRRQREEVNGATNAHHDVAERDRNGGTHHLLDDGGIAGHPASNFGRPVLFEKGGALTQQIAVHRKPDVGDGAFTQPGYEVEPECRRDRHNRHDHQQILKPASDTVGITARHKSAVDNQTDARRYRQCCQRRYSERKQRKHDLFGISRSMAPNHLQIAQLLGICRNFIGFFRIFGRWTLNFGRCVHGARVAGSTSCHNAGKQLAVARSVFLWCNAQ